MTTSTRRTRPRLPVHMTALALALLPALATAADYSVCASGCTATSLQALFNARNLAGGDVVTVQHGTYGAATMPEDDAGTAGNPVRIVGVRGPGGARPVLQGGIHTFKFQLSNHVVLEGFEIRGGSSTCVFVEAHDVTVRDSEIHACPAHGILGADDNSGSFTLEYSYVHDAGAGQTKHPLYMQADEYEHADAVFRMRFNVVRDGNGGNLLKSRHRRNEIHYNWFEGAAFQEIELIGPDVETQHPMWTEDFAREDSDVVGNVIVHTGTWRNAIRLGGDLNGRSKGLVRLVNNTIVFDTPITNARAVLVQLGLAALEMHNNAIFQLGDAEPAIVSEIVAEDDPPWGDTSPWIGNRRVAGSNNWVETDATAVPAEWSSTLRGAAPGFANATQRDFTPVPPSLLIDAGNNNPAPAPSFDITGALPTPLWLPPTGAPVAPGTATMRPLDTVLDIGALEPGVSDVLLRDGFE